VASLPIIPGYELLRPLGGGPLTHVFAARRLLDGSTCALKLPRPEWADLTDAVRLLRREARALRVIRHAHVVRLIDTHLADEPQFLVLEYLSGESLRDRLQRDFVIQPRETFWIARQIAEGLQAIHAAGCVHGDIKPDNVQLVEGGAAVVLDLGFAHWLGDAASWAAEGYVLGTANYLAPERAALPPRNDFAVDWFSFGVLLFEMLTGELPHQPRSLSEVLNHAIAASAPPAVLRMPERLSALIGGLLNPIPVARPRGPLIVHELIALEIAALGQRRAG